VGQGQGQGTQSGGPVEHGEAEAVLCGALFFGHPASYEGHEDVLAGGLCGLTMINGIKCVRACGACVCLPCWFCRRS
jgi:hypothetical protein